MRNRLNLNEEIPITDDVANYYLSTLAKDKTPFETFHEQDYRRRRIRRAEICLQKYERSNQLRWMQNHNVVARVFHTIFGGRESA
jgi:hypothetical protein